MSDLTVHDSVKKVPIAALHPFKDHPFRVTDDAFMHSLTDSIRTQGVLTPLLVRPHGESEYEIVSGHRRFHAASLAELAEIPVIIHDLDDDSAIIMMVDSNLQRESILPSERAKAYKMKMEAMRRQAGRSQKENVSQVGTQKRTDQIIAEEVGESRNQVHRYVRLTNLIPELLQMVDAKQIAFNTAVELSYLADEEQAAVLRTAGSKQIQLTQAQQFKKLSKVGKFTSDAVHDILFPPSKPKQPLPSAPPPVTSSPPAKQKASTASAPLSNPNPKIKPAVTDGTTYLSDSDIESFLIVEDVSSPASQAPPMTSDEVFYELNDAMEDMLYRWRRSYNLYNAILVVPEHTQHVKDMLGIFYSKIDEIIKEKHTL